MMVTIVCPECRKDDMIHKVSAMYSGGFSTIQNNSPLVAYGVEQRNVTTITPLAQKLAPPALPDEPGKQIGCGSYILACIVSIIVVFICGISGIGGSWMVFISIGALLGSLLLSSRNLSIKQQEYKALYPIWKQRKERWNELYYCSRNDCVFDPKEGKAISADRINELIYR
jgi:hypothetical protein